MVGILDNGKNGGALAVGGSWVGRLPPARTRGKGGIVATEKAHHYTTAAVGCSAFQYMVVD